MRAEEMTVAEAERRVKLAGDLLASRLEEIEREDDVLDPDEDIEIFLTAIRGDKRMLDLGCGRARYAHKFIRHGCTYVGIDISPGFVREALKLTPLVAAMSFGALGFEDETFDGVWSCCALGYYPKRNMATALSEMRRVLVKGGVAVIVLPYTDYGWETVGQFHRYVDIEGYYACWDQDELTTALEQAGFAVYGSLPNPNYGSVVYVAHSK